MTGVRVTPAVNGRECPLDVEPQQTLAQVLGTLGASSVHVGCVDGTCGGCTVLVDGEATRSCLMFAVQADGVQVRTLEGLAADHPLRTVAAGPDPCLPGLVMLAAGAREKDPERLRALLAGNVCRRAEHEKLREAVVQAATSGDPVA